jgi:hypothetical protein
MSGMTASIEHPKQYEVYPPVCTGAEGKWYTFISDAILAHTTVPVVPVRAIDRAAGTPFDGLWAVKKQQLKSEPTFLIVRGPYAGFIGANVSYGKHLEALMDYFGMSRRMMTQITQNGVDTVLLRPLVNPATFDTFPPAWQKQLSDCMPDISSMRGMESILELARTQPVYWFAPVFLRMLRKAGVEVDADAYYSNTVKPYEDKLRRLKANHTSSG